MTAIAALIVAAGRGLRARDPQVPVTADTRAPKQYAHIAGVPLLAYTLQPFLEHIRIGSVCVVIHPDDTDQYEHVVRAIAAAGREKLLPPVFGGSSRQQSVLRGLESFAKAPPDRVFIHDAARPYLTARNLDALIDAARSGRAAILASPLSDTLKRADDAGNIEATLPRSRLWRAETPQAFLFQDILAAHEKAARGGLEDFTDDASIAEWAGIPVSVVDSGGGNDKVTGGTDLALARLRLASAHASPPVPDIRTGQGVDIHRFKTGDHVWLCGVKIPHDRGVDAHSDGDVALHAVCDALLGAIGDGDIGTHFKNTDPRWRNASSDRFVVDACRRISARGARVVNVDVTILAEAPKVAPYRAQMLARLSEILQLSADRIGLKATTTERLGFAGRGEGLAAMATATVAFPGAISFT